MKTSNNTLSGSPQDQGRESSNSGRRLKGISLAISATLAAVSALIGAGCQSTGNGKLSYADLQAEVEKMQNENAEMAKRVVPEGTQDELDIMKKIRHDVPDSLDFGEYVCAFGELLPAIIRGREIRDTLIVRIDKRISELRYYGTQYVKACKFLDEVELCTSTYAVPNKYRQEFVPQQWKQILREAALMWVDQLDAPVRRLKQTRRRLADKTPEELFRLARGEGKPYEHVREGYVGADFYSIDIIGDSTSSAASSFSCGVPEDIVEEAVEKYREQAATSTADSAAAPTSTDTAASTSTSTPDADSTSADTTNSAVAAAWHSLSQSLNPIKITAENSPDTVSFTVPSPMPADRLVKLRYYQGSSMESCIVMIPDSVSAGDTIEVPVLTPSLNMFVRQLGPWTVKIYKDSSSSVWYYGIVLAATEEDTVVNGCTLRDVRVLHGTHED